MTSSNPVTVVAWYRLCPGQREQWLETWQHLATIARSNPECRSFTLDLDPDEPNRCRVASTWSKGSAFDRFVRDVGLCWIERYLDYSQTPPRYARFALPSTEAPESAEVHPAHTCV